MGLKAQKGGKKPKTQNTPSGRLEHTTPWERSANKAAATALIGGTNKN